MQDLFLILIFDNEAIQKVIFQTFVILRKRTPD